jgi:formate dehydrogenase iron-sulfur subunit
MAAVKDGTVRMGLLYDTTLCVGCGGCYQACKERNALPASTGDFHQEPLSDRTYTVVNSVAGRYVRRLCMHCETPTCVSACPVGALEKSAPGPVVYHEDRCIGCRYCMQACPFSIPRYEWSKPLPRVRKCDLCADRLARGLGTACATACPTGATVSGPRADLVAEARRRIAAAPHRYQADIYGIEDVGGTSVLLISDVPLETLGYPKGLADPIPLLTWRVLSQVPRFAIAASIGLAGLWWITERRQEVARAAREDGGSES